MHLQTSKYKLYLYFFFFIFLSSIFNFQFIENYQNKFSLKTIKINGLAYYEQKIVEDEINNLRNLNIFKLKKDNVLEKLNKFDFLENIYVNKIIPSSIKINLSKTSILGKTIKNGDKFYIGRNGKFISSNQLPNVNETATVFGDFKIDEFLNLYVILNNYQLEVSNIEKYYYYKNKRWDLYFSNGQTIMLPPNNIDKSIKIFKKLLINNNLKNTKIIDLRVKNQIILTHKDE